MIYESYEIENYSVQGGREGERFEYFCLRSSLLRQLLTLDDFIKQMLSIHISVISSGPSRIKQPIYLYQAGLIMFSLDLGPDSLPSTFCLRKTSKWVSYFI